MSDHAVFLIHGLWGNKGHFWYVEQQLLEAHPDLKVHACTANEGNRTYDGIDVGGDRVCLEIEETLAKWREEGIKITKISIIGYSLGGLVARYVVGLLYAKGMFDSITPLIFTTFATPHLGIRHVNSGVFHSVANYLGPRLLSASGRQMFIADRFPKPLLLRMTEKDSIYIRGLALFKNRVAYANIINDRSVPYHTAAISQYDPYLDMTRVNLSYLPGYAPTILHPLRPIIPLVKPKEPMPVTNTRRFLFPIVIALILPLWATFFVLASLWQSFFSARRIRHHLLLQTNEQEEPTIEETGLSGAVQEVFEDVVDNAATLYSPNIDDRDEYFENDAEDAPLINGKGTPHHDGDSEKAVSVKREEYRLSLSDEQKLMLSGLRSIPWQIFGVHINKTSHSHAAIIRRHKWRRDLVEGEFVLKHYIDEQFQA